MASVNWMKATTQKAGAMKKHLGQSERENGKHSNEHIDKELSSQNYAIGCSDYAEALERMKARTKEVDEVLPPQRVRKDRVTCCFLELPCPRVLTEQGKSDEFFQKAHEIYKEFFGEKNTHGTFVHKDEVHEYTAKDGTTQMSCEHAHTLVSAFTAEKGINGKAFETRARIKALNKALDDMCVREFGIHLNTGETPERKSVEILKKETEARQELGELNKRVGELQRAEVESRGKFLEADEKATEAEIRASKAEKRAEVAEKRTATAENKLQEVNAQYEVANKGLKKVLDKKAKASKIPSLNPFAETVTYHKNALESVQKIGNEAYDALDKANRTMQEAVSVQQRAERKEQAIEPLYQQASAAHQQAEQERRRVQQLRQGMEQEIDKRAKAIAAAQVNAMFKDVPTSRQKRLEQFCSSISFDDGSSVLDAFEQREQILKKSRFKGR